MTTLDSKLNSLRPGQQLVLSSFNGITCHVERSGNGNELRFVRTFQDGSFVIFKSVKF